MAEMGQMDAYLMRAPRLQLALNPTHPPLATGDLELRARHNRPIGHSTLTARYHGKSFAVLGILTTKKFQIQISDKLRLIREEVQAGEIMVEEGELREEAAKERLGEASGARNRGR